MKQKSLILFGLLVMLFALAACGQTEEQGQAAPVEVTRLVEVPVVVTATVETPCIGENKPNLPVHEGEKWVFDPDACMWIKMAVSAEPIATTAVPDQLPKVVVDLINTFPQGLNSLFGNDSKDLGLITAPDNDSWNDPMNPTEILPIDEDGGMISLSTGYFWGLLGEFNDDGPVCRFAGPWGGPDGKPNYTYFIIGELHGTDIGAHQLTADHYPSGSASSGSGHPTEAQFAEALMMAVGHTSGTNDEIDPAPRVGIFRINSETCSVTYDLVTYLGDDEWEWAQTQKGTLPLVGDWNTNSTVFDVLED